MTIQCSRIPEAIADVLGGEASPELRGELESHLSACAACAREQQGLGELLSRARAMRVPEPPAEYWLDFAAELRRRIARGWDREHTAFPMSPWLGWLRPLAAAALLAAVTFLLLGLPSTPAPAPGGATALRPVEPAAIDPARAAALAAAFDLLGAEGPLNAPVEPLDAGSAGAAEEFIGSAPSGDVFAFLDSTQPLTPDETRAVVTALLSRFSG